MPFPSWRDLYLVIAGVLLGLLMGPAVLGRVAPGAYDAMWTGPTARNLARTLQESDAAVSQELERMRGTGVTEAAIEEHRTERRRDLAPLHRAVEQARDQRAAGLSLAVWLVLALVMVAETLQSPQPRSDRAVAVRPAAGRLITIRYALLALWLAILLARPTLFEPLRQPGMVVLIVLMIVVALVAGFVPLGPRRSSPGPDAEAH